jgi:D-alanyl-D-alanine carboxypeptidase/D-alanyl-D-alanine-endopeptidase (penicillin-binding protein 4)
VRQRLVAVLAALIALGTAAPAHALDADQVRHRLERAMLGAGPYSGAYARDLATGDELVAIRENTPRIPASIEKLFVTATALLRHGPDDELVTTVVSDADVDADGVLRGDLWLVGAGDPTLDEDDVRRLARRIDAAGVRRIRGGVVADDSAFDRRRGGPRTGYRADWDMGGRLGALVLRRGFQADPALYAAQRLHRRLRALGIRAGRRPRTGKAPDAAAELAFVTSPRIGDLIRAINVPSDNFYAEMLLKGLGLAFGGGGTTREGAEVVRRTLDDFGVHPRIDDGSGLSRRNRTTPRQVVRLFERMEGQDSARTWRDSLAVAGRTGTVHRRMRGTAAQDRCRVKTGTIRGVSNLAGICEVREDRHVAFAWLMNGVNPWSARAIQDRMTAILARYRPPPIAEAEPPAEEEAEEQAEGEAGVDVGATAAPRRPAG